MQKLNVKAFALAWGISAGVGFLLLGWVAMLGWGAKIVEVMSSFYLGYTPTFLGGIIGGIWAFFDWGIGAIIIALVYNAFLEEKKVSNPSQMPETHETHETHDQTPDN